MKIARKSYLRKCGMNFYELDPVLRDCHQNSFEELLENFFKKSPITSKIDWKLIQALLAVVSTSIIFSEDVQVAFLHFQLLNGSPLNFLVI